MKYELVITADTNDADYITSTNTVTMAEIEAIMPVIEAIKQFNANVKEWNDRHNWPTSEYADSSPEELYPDLDEDLLNKFGDYVPYGENGVHTIESIEYYPLPEKTKLI